MEVVVSQAVALAQIMFTVIARRLGAVGALYCAAAWFAFTAPAIKQVNGLSFATLRTRFCFHREPSSVDNYTLNFRIMQKLGGGVPDR